MADITPYDVLPYLSGARFATHPDRLAVIGTLLGLNPAPPNTARILELGCGDGGNLIPMAASLPGSEFVGIDLAPTAIERGKEAIDALGIGNVRLRQGDIAASGDELGQFDYVIAHGVYSWIPEAVRSALLALVCHVLRPNGLAFVSYNAEPGDHIRGILRGMMRMHTANISEPRRKIEQARALLGLLNAAPGEAGDAYRALLHSEVGKALAQSDHLLYHDDLADISQPFFFTEFMAAARAAGLEFAAEVPFHAMSLQSLPPELAEPLAELGETDIIAKEQYLDFVTCRGFRQTLLCHREAPIDRSVTLERVRLLRVVSDLGRACDSAQDGGVVEFCSASGNSLQTDSKAAIVALDNLSAAYPCSIAFDELAAQSGACEPAEAEQLAEVFYRSFAAGLLGFRCHEPLDGHSPNQHPVASSWARSHTVNGRVVNLYHETVRVEPWDADVLPLLDGSRTLEEVAAAVGCDAGEVRASLDRLERLALIEG